MRGRIWFPAVILIIVLGLLVNGWIELSAKSMLFPWWLGGALSILLTVQLVRELRETRRKAIEGKAEEAGFKRWRTYLPPMAWLLAILPMIYLLGYLVTVPLYTFLVLKFHGERWLLSFLIASAAGVFLYVAFSLLLKVPFYEGLLFS